MGSHIPALKDRPSSVKRLQGLIISHPSISRTDKLIGLALLNSLHMRLWRCEVAQKTVAQRLGCSVRTVARALKALKAAGLVRWRRRRRRCSEYVFDLRRLLRGLTAPQGRDEPYRRDGDPLIRPVRPVTEADFRGDHMLWRPEVVAEFRRRYPAIRLAGLDVGSAS